MFEATDMRRSVMVDGVEYFVEVKRSLPRHYDRFFTRSYAMVELPNRWQATVAVPDGVRSARQLWYRELLELVQTARLLVGRRSHAA